MAIRYTGDVEVRITRHQGSYRALVRWPGQRGTATISAWELGLGPEEWFGSIPSAQRELSSPEAYDRAAYLAVRSVEARLRRRLPVELEGARMMIRRRFQSPCPILRRHSRS